MAFESGDAEKILKVMGLPVSSYTLTQIKSCMDTLEDISSSSVTEVESIIDDYETAETAYEKQNTDNEGGTKVLVKADVLEWEYIGGQQYSPANQMKYLRDQMYRYFGSCMGVEPPGAYGTPLIRS